MYFDAHSDIWTDVCNKRLVGEDDIFAKYHLERFKKGKIEGSIFVIWVDPPFTSDYQKRTKQIMECAKAEIAQAKDFRIVYGYDDILKAKAEGKIYVLIGVEGMAYIGEDLSKIDEYYDFGARHAMLTWNEENALGAGANSGVVTGLTAVGKKAAKIVQDKNMILDVSHLNEAGFWDITKLATKPIMASHSNCKALCDVPRNLTDDQLRAIRDLDGVVGLNAFTPFVSHDKEKQTIEELARHCDHMINIMGIDHVGCGFDFFEFIPQETSTDFANADELSVKGMKDCSEVPNLFKCFEKLGMSKTEMEKIAHVNIQNFIKKTVG